MKIDAKHFIQTYQRFVDDYEIIRHELEQCTNQIRSTNILSLANSANTYTKRMFDEMDQVMIVISDRLKSIMNEESGS